MKYTVNCTIKDKQGRDIGLPRRLWSGAADDAKCAIASAHEVLGPIIKAETRADTIVLFVRDAQGGLVTATEYAEDFTIGYGASAVESTGLLADKIDLGLSEAQKAEAMRALKARAIAAMPGLAPRTCAKDSVDAFDRAFPGYANSDGSTKSRHEAVEKTRIADGVVNFPSEGGLGWPLWKSISMDGFGEAIKTTEQAIDDFADAIKRVDERDAMRSLIDDLVHVRDSRTVSWLIRDAMLKAEEHNKKIKEILCSSKMFHELAYEMGYWPNRDTSKLAFGGIPVFCYWTLPEGDVKFIMEAK